MTKHIVISGAGPAGLYAAIVLLNRNTPQDKKYTVELVDVGDDYGRNDIKPKRSWMIGMSAHGIGALKKVPGLFEDYVSKVGVLLKGVSIHVSKRMMHFDTSEMGEAYNVDRNFVVAELSRYLHDNYDKDPALKMNWNTKVLYVDGEKHEALARDIKTGRNVVFKYDYLLGCDGSRSSTRAAFHAAHRDFECTYTSTMGLGKGAHIDFPKSLNQHSMHVLVDPIPGCVSFCLVEQGGKMNFNLGYDIMKGCAPELKSKDPIVLAKYLRTNMTKNAPIFSETLDFDEIARQFAEQDFNSIYQVHCNYYHSLSLQALLFGDAAHATLPTLGQGMNQAFVDVKVLNELLNEHGDNAWEKILPLYSKARVKEGNALTFMSYYWLSKDPLQQTFLTIGQAIRGTLHKIFPTWVECDPVTFAGKGGSFAKAYDMLKGQGTIDRVRRVNDGMYMEHFERQTGMVVDKPKSRFPLWAVVLSVGAGLLFASL